MGSMDGPIQKNGNPKGRNLARDGHLPSKVEHIAKTLKKRTALLIWAKCNLKKQNESAWKHDARTLLKR